MKKRLTLLVAFAAAFMTGFAQQAPNRSFETWTNPYNPDGWIGVEILLQNLIPFPNAVFTFRDTTSFTDGATSVKVVADTIPGASTLGVIPGVVSLGTGALVGQTPQFTGIPFIYRPDSIFFDYKFTSPGVDSGGASISLTYKAAPIMAVPGRQALQTKLAPDSNWVHMAVAVAPFYLNNNYPDTMLIQFVSSTANASVMGSTLSIDNVRFGYINPPVSVTASGTTTFCTGDSVTLHAHTGTSSAFSYQWNLGGTPISGATGSSFLAKAGGSYTVVIDSSGTTATSQAIIVTDTTCVSGIHDIAAANLSVYPNPANNVLNIHADLNLGGYNLAVYDLVGKNIFNQILEGSNNAVNIEKLATGTYLYRITDKANGIVSQSKFDVIK